jgi:putative Ig domain-containing protein
MAIVTRRAFLILLLVPAASFAANITGRWFTTSEKVARQDLWPRVSCTSCTYTTNWNGNYAYMFGGKGEILHGIAYLQNNSGADATNVNIQISSFTDNAGHFIIPLTVSSTTVWDSNASGPINLFYYQYLQIKGLNQGNYDANEVDERDLPPNFRVPCTGTAPCSPTSSTWLWRNRPDHDKFYPEIALPYESIRASSFTVASSSSQAIGIDIYLDTNTFIAANQSFNIFYGTMSVYEGVTLSTTVPIHLKVYNFTMPTRARLPVLGAIGGSHISLFHYNSSGTVVVGGARQTTREHYYQYMWRNRVIPIGDDETGFNNSPKHDYPTPEYAEQLDGSLFTPSKGFGNSPEVSTGVPFYMIGTYTSWFDPVNWSSTTITGGSGAFCTNVSSWSFNMGQKYPGVRSPLYLYDEPADSMTLVYTVERLANDMTNVCSMPGTTINSWVTEVWTNTLSSAPHVNNPTTTIWASFSSLQPTWITAAANYETSGTTQAWAYNGHSPASGSALDTSETGQAAELLGPASFKKGVQGWFQWEMVNWDNVNNSPNVIDDLWNDDKTFGATVVYASFSVTGVVTLSSCPYADSNGFQYNTAGTQFMSGGTGWLIMLSTNPSNSYFNPSSSYPGTLTKTPSSCTGDSTITYSSWTKTIVNPVRGANGFDHGIGDGVLLYPGVNSQDPAHNYGIDGPIGSFRLKMMRNGINMYDYASMAYAVNPTSASAIVNTIVPTILYELQPEVGHGYYFTGRQWSDDPQVWESNRELLAQWIAAPASSTITSALTATATNGIAFSYQTTASNSPQSFSASGLPPGLSINAATGLISGTIPAGNYGTYNIVLTATNALGAGPSSTLVLTCNRITLLFKTRVR